MTTTRNERVELQAKLKKLIDSLYDGDPRQAFLAYANGRGNVGWPELRDILSNADVGNWATRTAWIDGILAEVDTNKDGEISLAEFEAILR